jgi:hypothetical protein
MRRGEIAIVKFDTPVWTTNTDIPYWLASGTFVMVLSPVLTDDTFASRAGWCEVLVPSASQDNIFFVDYHALDPLIIDEN